MANTDMNTKDDQIKTANAASSELISGVSTAVNAIKMLTAKDRIKATTKANAILPIALSHPTICHES